MTIFFLIIQYFSTKTTVVDSSSFFEVIILFLILITFTFLGQSFFFYTNILSISENNYSVDSFVLEHFFIEFMLNKDF